MLVEKAIESRITDALKALPSLSSACIIESRGSTAAGIVKGTADPSAPQIVAVALGLRAHDSFSLPTVNISASIALTTRAELCPTGAEHEAALEEIAALLALWHKDGEVMTAALSIPEHFFAAELRMDGGDGKTYDQATSAWLETISFTIRGTLLG